MQKETRYGYVLTIFCYSPPHPPALPLPTLARCPHRGRGTRPPHRPNLHAVREYNAPTRLALGLGPPTRHEPTTALMPNNNNNAPAGSPPTPHNAHTLASTRDCHYQYYCMCCMVYSKHTNGRSEKGSRAYCPRILQWYCTRVGNAGGRGECKRGWLIRT